MNNAPTEMPRSDRIRTYAHAYLEGGAKAVIDASSGSYDEDIWALAMSVEYGQHDHPTHKVTLTVGKVYPPQTHTNISRTLTLEVADGGGAAWRARYLYLNGAKVAHIGVDPNNGVTPQCFGSLLGRDFRFGLPTLRWKTDMPPWRLAAYKVVKRFWHNVDGRYGWGSQYGGLPLFKEELEQYLRVRR